jgi:hypothetical protein
MKTLVLVLTLLSSVTFAQEKPQIEPGPVVTLSEESQEVADLLIDRQMRECIAQLQEHDSAITQVTRQALSPKQTVYVISGILLRGGDMVAGRFELVIDRLHQARLGIGSNTLLTCSLKVTGDKN